MPKGSVLSLLALGVVLGAGTASAQPAPAPPAQPPADAKPKPAKPKPGKPDTGKKPGEKPKPAGAGAESPAGDQAAGAKPGTAPAQPPAGGPAEGAPPTEGQGGEGTAGAGEGEAGGEAAGEEPGTPPAAPPGTRQPRTPATGLGPMTSWPQPGSDASALEHQGGESKGAAAEKADEDRVYAEDWWSHARPILELHGYYRLRAELFHNFSLGRVDTPSTALWPMPIDNQYNTVYGDHAYGPSVCKGSQSPEASNSSTDPAQATWPCKDKTQAGANMRFRLEPELHISDNLRIMSQIDLLDNLVLGSTPEGYANQPGKAGGYTVVKRGGYAPLGAFDTTQVPPTAGVNGFRDSIRVKRVWAEYMTPVGQLRFGRMPSHWGLGILANSGDGYDDDYQSTADRIMFVTGIKSMDLYFAGAWDFVNEGPTSASLSNPEGQPYDLAQLDDVNQYVFVVVHKTNKELQKLQLAKGNIVVNGGAYVVYRSQTLANDATNGALDTCTGQAALGCAPETYSQGYVNRGAKAWIPDLWLQLLYKKFRFEMEAVTIQGSIDNLAFTGGTSDYSAQLGGYKLREYGIATELEQRLVEDRLKLQFKWGWASGDPDVSGPVSGGLSPGFNGLQPQQGDRTISTFRFHPNYKIDLILNRNILSRVQGSYYFRPSVDYDFVRNTNGQRFGGGFAAIWTRASQFIQTPGHDANLGIELDGTIYFQSKDGSLNDDPDKMGGFYTALQYGVLFPLAGLGYQPVQTTQLQHDINAGAADTSAAQILRWYMGVLF